MGSYRTIDGGYDLSADKRTRANARFHGLSLGAAASRFKAEPYLKVTGCHSFRASDKLSLSHNEELSQTEQEIVIKMIAYDGTASQEMKEKHPVLFQWVKDAATKSLSSELAKAKRARHVGAVIQYVRRLDALPSRQKLVLDDIDVPY